MSLSLRRGRSLPRNWDLGCFAVWSICDGLYARQAKSPEVKTSGPVRSISWTRLRSWLEVVIHAEFGRVYALEFLIETKGAPHGIGTACQHIVTDAEK
jgi:hypothetical protein